MVHFSLKINYSYKIIQISYTFFDIFYHSVKLTKSLEPQYRKGTPMGHADMYQAFEDTQVIAFWRHDWLLRLNQMTREEATNVLLQMGHSSTEFVPWYEQAKLGLRDERAKEAIRQILRDEIPAVGPTHQDNRITDLLVFGVPLELMLSAPATAETRWVIEQAYRLVRPSDDPFHALRVMVTLQMMGERLVAESYRPIVENMERWFKVPQARSVFYRPHYEHDSSGGEHANCFARVIHDLITTQEASHVAMDAARIAWETKLRFFEQFRWMR